MLLAASTTPLRRRPTARPDPDLASPNSPGTDATGAQVIAWYGSHHTSDFVFDLIGGLAVLFLVLFAVALARQVRTGDRWLAHGALAGAVFGGVGFLTSVGFDTCSRRTTTI